MTIKFSDITGGGIPFGNTAGRPQNPGIGKLYSNGEAQRLELYTGPQYGWQNIVAETPGVTGYTGTISETSGGTIVISGTNFSSGAIATIIGSDGTEYTAITTSVNNLTSITAVFAPASASKEPYDIRVTNPSNLYGVYYDILTINDKPIWQTPAGSLGSFIEESSVTISLLSASDEENNTLTYSSTNLPGWLSLNPSSGLLTGTAPSISTDTTYSFNVSVSDGVNTAQSRSFSVTLLNIDGSNAQRAFPSPTYAQSIGASAGTYHFKSSSMTSSTQLYYSGSNYEDSSAFVRVFSSPFASTATVNFMDLSIPFNKFLIRRDDGAYKALVRFDTDQLYNETLGITGSSGTNNIGQTVGLKVMLGGAGGHGVYNSNQQRCNWGNSTGSVAAGFDGQCGSFPNGLRWGTGTGSASYTNMSGTFEHWVSW